MVLPVVEIIKAPATEAFRADPRNVPLITPAFEALNKAEGLIKSWYGTQHENNRNAFSAVAWEALGYHYNFMTETETYSILVEEIQAMLDVTKLTAYHVALVNEPYDALSAPATEIATFQLHAGQAKDALEERVNDLANALHAIGKDAGVVSAAWGPVIEDESMVVLLVGWTCVDAHRMLVTTDQKIITMIDDCRAISTVELLHVQFSTYE